MELVVRERETSALERELEGAALLARSLVLVEVPRALGRLGLDPHGADVLPLLDEARAHGLPVLSPGADT